MRLMSHIIEDIEQQRRIRAKTMAVTCLSIAGKENLVIYLGQSSGNVTVYDRGQERGYRKKI